MVSGKHGMGGTPLPPRFWTKVGHRRPNECWPWTGCISARGYGQFFIRKVDGRSIRGYAHRLTYEELVGPIPEGTELDHLCRNRACCNPDHLEAVSHAVNSRRAFGTVGPNGSRLRCLRGHDLTTPGALYTKRGKNECAPCRSDRAKEYAERKRQ